MTFNILFVCTGNVCRSPAAERLLRRDLDRVGRWDRRALRGQRRQRRDRVRSSATRSAHRWRRSSPRRGADAEDFVARQITPAVVRAADLVITMSSAHRRETVTLVPAAVQHTFVLGELEHMLGARRPRTR